MPLNYSKWNNLELSDDSDIEGHPNVDKKSLIRWKQRDIHEKREARKAKIAQLKLDIQVNEVLSGKLAQVITDVTSGGKTYFSQLVERLHTQPSPEKPEGPNVKSDHITYDAMLYEMLTGVWNELKEKGANKDDENLDEKLVNGLKEQQKRAAAQLQKLKTDLATEEKEQAKKITTDDIHEGFSSKYTPAASAPEPLVPPPKSKGKQTARETKIEVLNPGASSSTSSAPPPAAADDADDEEDDDDTIVPSLTPSLYLFSKIPVKAYEQSWKFIQSHRDVIVEGATDALLVAGFEAQGKGQSTYAKQCVHQGLLLQYCEKLGKDGVRLFFQRMVSGDPRAETVFSNDVEQTYTHMARRVAETKVEEAMETRREQIQLVPEDPSVLISFNVPDGPPPEHLVLEGPGTEDLDIEEVRKALQLRWDVFQSFTEPMKKALKAGSLDRVNKILGKLEVPEAEQLVQSLQLAGILSFADGGAVRDETKPRPIPAEE